MCVTNLFAIDDNEIMRVVTNNGGIKIVYLPCLIFFVKAYPIKNLRHLFFHRTPVTLCMGLTGYYGIFKTAMQKPIDKSYATLCKIRGWSVKSLR